MRPYLLLLSAAASLSACSNTRIPSPADLPIVYKIDVQQGNVITQDMVAQLKPGMDRSKVKFIMGTPVVADVFHQDRWDYLYTMQKRGGERSQRRISLYFKDDKLDRIEGDVRPAAGEFTTPEKARSTTVAVPGEQATTLVGKIRQSLSDEEEAPKADAKAAAAAAPPAEAAPAPAADQATGETPAAKPDAATPPVTAAEKSEGSGKPTETATAETRKPGSEVVIPDDAPRPPEKGFFRKLLEKVGVGDNEEGEYESVDPKYRDPSNPEVAR
jgi:outer membrane protein assembly factor BamE